MTAMKKHVSASQEANSQTRYRKYEVDRESCILKIGDLVYPHSLVGFHPITRQPIKAQITGKIATMHFNPMNLSLMIMAICHDAVEAAF